MKYIGAEIGKNKKKTGKVTIDKIDIDEINEYNYLSQIVAFKDSAEKEVKTRKSMGKILVLEKSLQKQNLALKSRIKILDSLDSCVRVKQ